MVDVSDVAQMTEDQKRKLLADLWAKNPPVSAKPSGASGQQRQGPGPPQKPPGGPGTALKQLLTDIGIGSDLVGAMCGKGCADYSAMMDTWGVAGCRERFYEIAGRLHDQAIKHKARFRDDPILWAKLAARGAKMGLVLNPASPYAGLVEEAIRRAEESVNH